MKKDIIIGLGEILWDVFPERKILGGAPANFAYHASQFGFNGYAVSAIGNDLLGKEIIDSLTEKQLNYVLETTPYPTGTVQVTLSANGIPHYEITENVAWDNIPFTEQMEKLAKECKAVSFGSLAQRNHISGETIRRFIDKVSDDAFKIFDINLRQHFYTQEIIDNSLKRCNVLKINEEEIIIIGKLFNWPESEELKIAKRLINDYNLKILVLTKGEFGSYVLTSQETFFRETPKVHVADTVGAGDSFTGAFVAALLSGESITKAHQLAIEVSAYVCTQHGAMPKLPDAFVELFQKNMPEESR